MSILAAFGLKRCASGLFVFRLTNLEEEEVRLGVGVYVGDLIVTGETSC